MRPPRFCQSYKTGLGGLAKFIARGDKMPNSAGHGTFSRVLIRCRITQTLMLLPASHPKAGQTKNPLQTAPCPDSG